MFGAGYVVCSDLSQCQAFLQQCPSQVPFLPDDMNGQPEIGAAPYPKPFRAKEKVDKLAGTYESDPEFLAFKQQLENPSAVGLAEFAILFASYYCFFSSCGDHDACRRARR